MAEGLIDTREVANNIADLSGIIKNKAYRGSVRGNISNITTNNLVIGTHGNIVEALNLVSQSAHGRMSKEDKKKLDSIESGSNKYIHPDTHPASMITEDAAKRFVSQAMVDGWNADIANRYTKAEIDNMISGLLQNIDWKESVNTFADLATTYPNPQDGWTVNVKDTDITYRWSGTAWIAISLNALPLATQTVDGKMSKEDKAKLDGIALNANNYVHPTTHPATMITEDATHRFVSDTEKSTWNNKANASHGNHVPTTETANNTRFLRNDNTWQAVTPGNIGAYTKSEIDSKLAAGTWDGWYQKNAAAMSGDVNTLFKYGKTGFFCGSSLTNQMPWGTHTWKHYITMSHGNTAGYTGMIGMNFDGDEIGFKAISNGADKGWKRFWHSGNFDPNSKLNASAPHTGATFKSTYQGGNFAYAGQHQWEAPYFHTFDNGGSSDYHPIIKQRYHMPNIYYGRWSFGTLCNGSGDAPFVLHHISETGADQMQFYFHRTGVFNCPRVYNAVWNDYAELFPKPKGYETEPGDIITLDIESDKEVYIKATEETSSFIVGVHSDEYAHIIGGERPSDDYSGTFEEFNKDKYVPVGLAGRVKVKCIGIIKKGDKLVISDIPGVARAFNPKLDNINNVFGMAVENKNNPDVITRVRMFIKN